MVRANPTIIELDMHELDDLLQRIDAQELHAEDYATLHCVIDAYVGLYHTVGDKTTSIARLRKMLFGATTEKTAAVVGQHTAACDGAAGPGSRTSSAGDATTDVAEAAVTAESHSGGQAAIQEKRKNHGRNGADAHASAERIEVPHESLQPGDACPQCDKGTVYDTRRPHTLVRLIGQSPVRVAVYCLQVLRCAICGALFPAKQPSEAGDRKYDATAGSMIGLLKYGTGVPFNRNETLHESLGVCLPASTQWDIVADQAERAEPVFQELVRQAAQADVVYNDDTYVKILAMMGKRVATVESADEPSKDAGQEMVEANAEPEPQPQADATTQADKMKPTADRKGLFTTGIVAEIAQGRKIALFFSGRQHAGENLQDVLLKRAADLPPPIQMCDALSRNMPGTLATIVANCMAHGRRKFVDKVEQFHDECRHVLETLAVVYHNDELAKQKNKTPEERLIFHQTESGPVMEQLHAWLRRQLDDKLVEPNSGLGACIAYMLRHWQKLTLFLRVAGAPLDNNICERALKMAIRHRKNSLFYKTLRGAHVGDVFMSMIHTCRLCGVNPFDYLTEVDRHAEQAALNPGDWLPWNYRQTLAAADQMPAAA